MRGYPRRKKWSYKRFYPSILIIALCSHYAYYYNVFCGEYTTCIPLVLLAIICMTLGYTFGSFVRITFRRKTYISRASTYHPTAIQAGTLRKAAVIFILIGVMAHLVYYIQNPVITYAGSYTASQGSGYITVFFNFWLLGMVLMEYLIVHGENRRFLKITNRVLIILYTLFYVVVLMKRRQVIMLFLALLAIWGSRMRRKKKVLMYVTGIFAAAAFMFMGRARGYIDNYGFLGAIPHIVDSFSWEWLSLEKFEGRYVSRTLNDIHGYVKSIGHDPSILLGVLFCMIPRRLLGGVKPLAFPEWYTKHFYPADYARGTGYAGSLVAELYLIGGIPLLMLGYFVIGYISARIQKNITKRKNVLNLLIYSLFIYTILLLPRYDLASLLIDIVFLYLPIILLCSRCMTAQKP